MTTRRTRGFEVVDEPHRQHAGLPALPLRSSAASAGYDLCTPVALRLEAGGRVRVATDLKAYMGAGEVLMLFPRSSSALRGLALCNTVGIIDSDYYSNPNNDGNIILALENRGEQAFEAAAGERLVQAVFMPYLLADGDSAAAERQGGFGSTGRGGVP